MREVPLDVDKAPDRPYNSGMEEVKQTVRFEEDVHKAVRELADGDRRSFNAEVNVLLREAVEARRCREK